MNRPCLSAAVVTARLRALEADADGFAERLRTTRGWEIATMEGRPAICEASADSALAGSV